MTVACGGMVTASDVEAYSELFAQVARRAARDWPGIDADDIEQEIWVELIPKWGSLRGDTPLMRAAAERVARSYCIKERYTSMMGTNEYVYTPAEVRALFREAFFNEAAREALPEHRDTVYAGGVACGVWDLDAVFERLSDPQRAVIERRYLMGETLDQADEKRLSRAIEQATRLLNWRTDARQRERDYCE